MPCADPMLHCWLPWHALCCVVPRCACALRCTRSAPLCPTACPLHCIPLHSNLLCSRQSTTPTSFASLPTTGPRSWPAAAVRAGLVAVVQLFSAGGAHYLCSPGAHASTRVLTWTQCRMPGLLASPASPGIPSLPTTRPAARFEPDWRACVPAPRPHLPGRGNQQYPGGLWAAGLYTLPLPTRVAALRPGPRVIAHELLACSALVQLALLAA